MVVLARPVDAMAGLVPTETRAPWQTRFARGPVAPPADRRVAPIAIPVFGGRPIEGRRLVRAPWAEPLAAFAGVVVETQHVPDGWLAGRPATRPVVAIPVVTDSTPSLPPRRLTPIPPHGHDGHAGLVAIPVAVPIAAGSAAAHPDGARPLPGRIIPFPESAASPATATGPIVAPATPDRPAPIQARRGFLARTLTLTLAVLGLASLAVRR